MAYSRVIPKNYTERYVEENDDYRIVVASSELGCAVFLNGRFLTVFQESDSISDPIGQAYNMLLNLHLELQEMLYS